MLDLEIPIRNSQENKIKNSGIIEPVDPSLHLPGIPYNNDGIEQLNLNNNLIDTSFKIKNRLIVELFKEIMNDPNYSEEEKEKYNNIFQQINQKKYYYCYNNLYDPIIPNSVIFQDYEKIQAEPQVIVIPESINYDVELTKIGEKCSGLKKRYAIIKRGELKTSTKSIKELKEKDIAKIKDKTQYLRGADIYIERYNEQEKPQGEWTYKNKPMRIRIDYFSKPDNKKERKSICLYFDDENKMKEVFIILFGISLSDEKKMTIHNNLLLSDNTFTNANRFYTIMKILSVKNKIKKRKSVFNKISNVIKGSVINAKLNHEEFKIIKKYRPLKGPNPKPRKQIQRIYSDFIQLITHISPQGGDKDLSKLKKSINILKWNHESLKDEIPSFEENILNASDDSMSFKIPMGVQIEKNGEFDNFLLSPEIMNQTNYIYFDKNKPEIKFKRQNNLDDNMREDDNQNNILFDYNIYEISNVILNSDINMSEMNENNLVICGPKIDNNKGFTYSYKEDSSLYLDPELMNIKGKTYNEYNKKKIKGMTIQIYHSEIEINDFKLNDLLVNLTGSVVDNNTIENIKEKILFGYTIKILELKNIESLYVPPKDFKNKICFIEYNQQYFIPDDYKDSDIIIECFCLPKNSFGKSEDDNQENGKNKYIGIEKYLSPIKLGYVKLNYNDFYNIHKYPIENDGMTLPNSFLILGKYDDYIENNKLKNIHGKDYSIGSDSYIEKSIDSKFFEDIKKNENLPKKIKEKYGDVYLNQEEILLRSNEEDKFEEEILSQLADEQDPQMILKNIKLNNKYNFLPYCEKYKSDETLFQSKNLNLSNEQREYIRNNYKIGDWIYKLPKIKVKLLSKNLGCQKNKFSQLLYIKEEKEDFSYDSLIKGNEDKVIPITENNFNVIDMREIKNLNGFDNYQWKTAIKFGNQIQMNTFLKLLLLARQNINTKEKNKIENRIIEFDREKLLQDKNVKKNYEINIQFIDFIDKIKIKNEHTYLKIKLCKPIDSSNQLNNLVNSQYDFKNSLIEKNEKIKRAAYEYCEILEFTKKVKLEKNKFNSGSKNLSFGKNMKREFEILNNRNSNISNQNSNINNYSNPNININNDNKGNNNSNLNNTSNQNTNKIIKNELEILIIMSDKDENNKDEYYSTINLEHIEPCVKLELPIYKKEEKDVKYKKIYGCLGIDLYEKKQDKSFDEEFEELNKKYIKEPLLIFINEKNKEKQFQIEYYHFGLYEPNVFRRKILNYIHNLKRIEKYGEKDSLEKSIPINIDPRNINNSDLNDLDFLYEKLKEKKCLKLPSKESFNTFDFNDIRKNYDDYDENSYKKKLALKLLKIKRHEDFMRLFRENEWVLYMNHMNKGEERMTNDTYIKNSDKNAFIENENDSKILRNLIYLGIPNDYRILFYKSFLEVRKLYEKTREALYQKENIEKEGEKIIFNHFADQILDKENETNLIFSLIDNDCIFVCSELNVTLEDIKSIKKIAKSFFLWSKLEIELPENDKYVYFIGLLYIIQKLKQITNEEYEVFWLIVGLSQCLDHFHQRDVLFTEEMNYINLYGLVCKLILETHQKEIFNKFISLNFPVEYFFSQHLSTLYTDYFNHELIIRILDILIYESSFKNLNNDKLQGLRVLCAIPITLMQIHKNRILACESVSEIDSIFNDLALHTFNHNKFIITLEKNIRNFFVYSSVFEKYIWFLNNKGREWDVKRGDLENLILSHFKPVYNENNNYLKEINKSLNKNAREIYNDYLNYLKKKLKSIQSVYYNHDSYNEDCSDMETLVMIHVSKLQHIYNNYNNDLNEYKLNISFGDDNLEIGKINKKEFNLEFDNDNNKINDISNLYLKEKFEGYNVPKFIHFELTDRNENRIATFVYQILHYEPMKISKIVVENKEPNIKYFLEFVIFKYTKKKLISDEIEFYNIIFGPPEYLHSNSIEDKLYSYSISNYSFKNKLKTLIGKENDFKNKLLNYKQLDENFHKKYKILNNNVKDEDEYNKHNLKNASKNIVPEVISIKDFFNQNDINENKIIEYIKKWLNETNVSLEEVLISLVLINKSLNSINDKLFLIYSFAQTKDNLLFKNDRLSINKAKEIIYSLYKRFMIYFTKTDVERMIDFILKDERLFNVKYAFIYNNTDRDKINEFIYDKDRYEPKLDKKKSFEIFFDNIDKQFNLYINHLNNHYKMQSISNDIIQFILSEILNKSNNLNLYKNNKFDTITLVIEKDNIIFKRNYKINYHPLIKIEEEKDPLFNISPESLSLGEIEIVDVQLCHEISNFDINNSYCKNNFISFDTFKEIFFKLPYLSDLFRVSFSYINEEKNQMINEFDNFKVSVYFEDDLSGDEYNIKVSNINNRENKIINYGEFYFPNNEYDDEINNSRYEINYKIKISDSVDYIIEKLIKYLKEKNGNKEYNEIFMLNNLNSLDKLSCCVYYFVDENSRDIKKKEKIGIFDRLNTCIELNDRHYAELEIIFKFNFFSFSPNRSQSKYLNLKENGYCKILYSNNNDFQWKKCRINPKKNNNAKLTSVDYESKPLFQNNDDITLAYNV